VQKIEALLFDFGFLGYVAAVTLYLTYVFSRRDRHGSLGHRILWGSAVLHAASLVLGSVDGKPSARSRGLRILDQLVHEFIAFFSLDSRCFSGSSDPRASCDLGGLCSALGSFLDGPGVDQGVPLKSSVSVRFGGRFSQSRGRHAALSVMPVSVWAAIHVPLLFLAYAAFANAFGIGLAFLIQERQIKTRRPTELGYRLPSLEEMDRLIARLIAVAFPALTLGLGLGIVWAHSAWGGRWVSDPKIIWSVVVWAVYLAYLVLRYGFNWRGRRAAYLSLAGFGLVLVSYMGINYVSRTHGYVAIEKQ
jgi:hypothetical protein